ncbi:DUF6233 domain-containing protein [Streptomyces sp. 1222.5]|uniref:DUF6233 domain-containing protein n=1 Tax=Streptomyces sp. 1222.5 TaxID=1881026 RepID=UPI003EB96B5E
MGAAVHRADCTVIQRDANPIGAEDARQALTGDGKFFHACEFCRPDTHLKIPGRRRSDGLSRLAGCSSVAAKRAFEVGGLPFMP